MVKADYSELTKLPSVGETTAQKLGESGYDTILSIAVAHPSNLVDASGVSEAVARKIIKAARDEMGFGFINGVETEQNIKVKKISTGSKAFDAILDGGVKSGGITEVFGEYGSGKTQVAHQLSVNVLSENPENTVVYIDTEGTFTPVRIRQMAKAKGLDEEDILKRIFIAKANNSDHQMFLAEQLDTLFKQGKKVELIIVDSLTAHFRAEYTGRGTLADRQQKLNKHMRVLQKVADLRNIPVFVTNQVSSNPGVFYGNPTQAIGGNIVGHNSRERIYLRRGAKGTRVAKLIDSPYLQDAEASYMVVEGGLADVE